MFVFFKDTKNKCHIMIEVTKLMKIIGKIVINID